MTHISLLLLTACGVEETGFLTDEGVFFTEDAGSTLVVVRAEAVTRTGGSLMLRTFEGIDAGSRTLGANGTAWVIEPTEGITLTYLLNGDRESADHPFTLDDGQAPVEDLAALLGDWVAVSGQALVVRPVALIGELPYLVVNQANGTSLRIDRLEDHDLEGIAGDRVCASSLVGDELTASVCREAE